MSTISSGVGLVSGLDIQSLISRLMAVESRPRDLLRTRIGALDAQKTALLDISARISGILSRVTSLSQISTFRSRSAASSAATVAAATVRSEAVPGSHSFIVQSLSSRQQVVSRGFASTSAAMPPGVLTLESARARVSVDRALSELNGMNGVRRGAFALTDAAGQTRTVDLADAITLNDVLRKINESGANVRARVVGDAIELTETTGGTLRIAEIDGGATAADLGFSTAHSTGAGVLRGNSLMRLSDATGLRQLNDGNGISRARAGGDFRFIQDDKQINVDLSGLLLDSTRIERLNGGGGAALGRVRITTVNNTGEDVIREVDLSGMRTIGQIRDALRTAVPELSVTTAGSRLIVGYAGSITDRRLEIADVTGTGARDLGIAGESANGRLSGGDILRVDALADVVRAINYAAGNDGSVQASIGALGLSIQTQGPFQLETIGDSAALRDLGLSAGAIEGQAQGSRLLGGLDTVMLRSLNGGRGFQLGTLLIEAGGVEGSLDLRGAATLGDVIHRFEEFSRQNGGGLSIALDANGTRLSVRSQNPDDTVVIRDLDGDFASATGLEARGGSIRSANLQRQYVSSSTLLSELAGGRQIAGRFRITAANGASAAVDIPATSQTVGEVIDRINSAGIGVRARINTTGDGLLLEDTSGGAGRLRVVDEGGGAARDLRILGDASSGRIDGSLETRIELTGATSLQALVAQINAAGAPVTAGILNDGTPTAPYRMQLTARSSGRIGEFLLDADVDLGLSTISRAQDARVILGSDPRAGVVLTSSTDTFANVVPGVDLNALSVSATPVTITVATDIEAARTALDGMVTAFNAALERIEQYGKYDAQTQSAGVLLGDSTLQAVQSRLFRMMSGSAIRANGAVTSLSQLGVKLESGRFRFDAAKFSEAMARDPQAVVDFFTRATAGVAVQMKKELEAITDSAGLIKRRGEALDRQKTDIDRRMAQLTTLIDRKRDRLTRQFQAMETALSQLQAQQGALGSISSFAFSNGGSR